MRKYIYITLGIICVGLGAIGIVLPLIPTTPFLLLSVYLFSQSSNRLKHWLIHHKVFGKYIYNYTVHKAITKRAKITSILMVWVTLSISMILTNKSIITLVLVVIGAFVTLHLLSLKTMRD